MTSSIQKDPVFKAWIIAMILMLTVMILCSSCSYKQYSYYPINGKHIEQKKKIGPAGKEQRDFRIVLTFIGLIVASRF